jgi:hypothetical protein
MKVRVRPLRSHGRKVKQYGTAAQGIVGEITMHRMLGGEQSYTAATLKAGLPKDPDLLPPLYEPTLVTISSNGLLLRGFESIDGASYVQEWHCELE